jgi:hypothetical protein
LSFRPKGEILVPNEERDLVFAPFDKGGLGGFYYERRCGMVKKLIPPALIIFEGKGGHPV